MLSSIDDPYYSYKDAEEAKQAQETLDGEYVGLGVEILLQ